MVEIVQCFRCKKNDHITSCPPWHMLRVVSAAIMQNGRLWTLPVPARHHALIQLMAKDGVHCLQESQGFLLSDGRFVVRKAAAMVAYYAGQIDEIPSTLTSEDLWDVFGRNPKTGETFK